MTSSLQPLHRLRCGGPLDFHLGQQTRCARPRCSTSLTLYHFHQFQIRSHLISSLLLGACIGLQEEHPG